MGADSAIEWTHHTFNPWWGCVKVSPGCAHCYADTFAKRVGQKVWGADAPRRFFGDKHWAEPLKWNRDAEQAGVRRRVFCASMADVFEDRPDLRDARATLFHVIGATPSLDWLLLTKRPENIPQLWAEATAFPPPWPNVWLGTTVEDQARADERILELRSAPAAVRFLSVEPLLELVDLSKHLWPVHDCWPAQFESPAAARAAGATVKRRRQALVAADSRFIDWVIVGGESGPGARPCDVAWILSVVRQCREAGVPCFVKQLGANVRDRNDAGFDGSDARAWPVELEQDDRIQFDPDGDRDGYQGAPVRVRLKDPKGGDPAEWPEDLRVREFPEVARA